MTVPNVNDFILLGLLAMVAVGYSGLNILCWMHAPQKLRRLLQFGTALCLLCIGVAIYLIILNQP